MLAWNKVSFHYDNRFFLENVSLEIKDKDFIFLTGPNGSGKSTLFKLGMGLLKPNSGAVELDGISLNQLAPFQIARKIAFLEQETQYLFPFTAEEIVLMGRFPHTVHQFWDQKEDEKIAVWAMETTGTLKFAKRSILELSGGERRKVEIARALCQKPDYLLLDEPTTFLDLKQQIEFFDLLRSLNQNEKVAVAVISHQIEFGKRFFDSAILMSEGKIRESGPVQTVLSEESINQFFRLKPADLRH